MMILVVLALAVLFVSDACAGNLELFLRQPLPPPARAERYPDALSLGRTLTFPREGYEHKLNFLPDMDVLDRLQFEFPGGEIVPPETINHKRKEKLLDHFPRFGLYVLVDADMAVYVTERYEPREYEGKLVARKDVLFESESIPADLAITVLDKDRYHRRTRDHLEVGVYGRLPFTVPIGSWRLGGEVSIAYDERAQFVALLRVHLSDE